MASKVPAKGTPKQAAKQPAPKSQAVKGAGEKRVCIVCGKPLRSDDPVGLETGIGPGCRKAGWKTKAERDKALIGFRGTVSESVDKDWVMMSQLCREADKAGIGTHRLVRAMGGDAGKEEPWDPIFKVHWVGNRKYGHKDILTKGFKLLQNPDYHPARRRGPLTPAKATTTKPASKTASKAKPKSDGKSDGQASHQTANVPKRAVAKPEVLSGFNEAAQRAKEITAEEKP